MIFVFFLLVYLRHWSVDLVNPLEGEEVHLAAALIQGCDHTAGLINKDALVGAVGNFVLAHEPSRRCLKNGHLLGVEARYDETFRDVDPEAGDGA